MSVLSAGLTQPANAVSVFRGESKVFDFELVDASGVPVDITGARILFTVKRAICAEDVLFRKDSAVGPTEVEITSAVGGQAQIKLEPSDTYSLDLGEYVFDVWVIFASGAQHPVIPPTTLVILPGVTTFP